MSHTRSKKHLRRAAEQIETEQETKEAKEDLKSENDIQIDPEESNPGNIIRIVDGAEGEKAEPVKGGLDKLMEYAFSEQMAPITMAILQGVAAKFSPSPNNEQSEGRLTQVGSGAYIKTIGDF